MQNFCSKLIVYGIIFAQNRGKSLLFVQYEVK